MSKHAGRIDSPDFHEIQDSVLPLHEVHLCRLQHPILRLRNKPSPIQMKQLLDRIEGAQLGCRPKVVYRLPQRSDAFKAEGPQLLKHVQVIRCLQTSEELVQVDLQFFILFGLSEWSALCVFALSLPLHHYFVEEIYCGLRFHSSCSA